MLNYEHLRDKSQHLLKWISSLNVISVPFEFATAIHFAVDVPNTSHKTNFCAAEKRNGALFPITALVAHVFNVCWLHRVLQPQELRFRLRLHDFIARAIRFIFRAGSIVVNVFSSVVNRWDYATDCMMHVLFFFFNASRNGYA